MTSVLLIEPDKKEQKNFKKIVKDEKFNLVGVTSYGKAGLYGYKKKKPDLVVAGLDVPLKKDQSTGGGIKFLKKFKEVFPDARIVITYTIDNQYLVVKAEKEIGVGKLKKPFREKSTLRALAKAVKAKRLEGVDRRQSVRVEKKFPLRYRKQNGSWFNFLAGMNNVITTDISSSGVRFQSNEDITVDDKLDLEVEIPDTDRTINTEGRVVRTKSHTGLDRVEVAVEFLELEEDEFEELNDYLLSIASNE